jgi:hypothetical protein
MKNLHLLLRENVPSLGRIGETVRVRQGYARNYLLPRRLAVEATADNVRAMEKKRARRGRGAGREVEISARISPGKITLGGGEGRLDRHALRLGRSGGHRDSGKMGVELAEKDIRLRPSRLRDPRVPIHVYGEHYGIGSWSPRPGD